MPMDWDSVTQTDTYKNTNALEQRNIAGQYFDQVIAPKYKIPDEHKDQARQQFAEQKVPDAVYITAKGVEAGLSNIGNLASELRAKASDFGTGTTNATKAYEQSPERAETQRLNTEQQQRVEEANKGASSINIPFVGRVGQGSVFNFIGQSAPAAAMGGAVGELGGTVGARVLGNTGDWLGSTIGMGEGATTTAPTNANTVDESLQQSKDNAKQAAWLSPLIDAGIRAPGLAKSAVDSGLSNFTEEGAEFKLGKNLKETLSPEESGKLQKYTQTPQDQQPYNLTTAAVAQSPHAANLENKLTSVNWQEGDKTISPANQLQIQKEQTSSTVSKDLHNINVNNANPEGIGQIAEQEAGAIKNTKIALDQAKQKNEQLESGVNSSVQNVKDSVISDPVTKQPITVATADKYAGENFLKAIDNNRNAERKAYNDIVKDKSAVMPVADMSEKANQIGKDADIDSLLLDRDGNRILTKYQTEGPVSSDDIPNMSVNLGINQASKYGVSTKLSDSNIPQVKVTDVVQDIADLNAIKAKHSAAMQNPLNTDRGLDARVIQAADTAKKTLESTLQDTPYAEAYAAAKQTVLDNNERLFRNPNVTRSNTTGNNILNDSQFTSLKRQYLGGESVSRAKVGESIYSPKEAEDTLANIKNVPNGPDYFKQQALTRIVDSLGDSPTVANFDKAFTPDVQRAMSLNGMGSQLDDIMSLRKSLEDNADSLAKQQAIMKNAEIDSKQASSDFEKTTASKFLDDNYKAIPKEKQVDKILKDKQLQDQVITKAQSVNDNGATLRGIGQNIIDKLKSDNIIKDARDSSGKPIQQIDAKGLNADLTKYSDVLSKTLDKPSLDALHTINDVAQKIEYSSNYNRGGIFKASGGANIGGSAIVETGSKVLKAAPPAAISRSLTGLKNIGERNYYKALLKAQDPYVAQSLIDSADKDPHALSVLLDKLTTSNVISKTAILNTNDKGNSQKINNFGGTTQNSTGQQNKTPVKSAPLKPQSLNQGDTNVGNQTNVADNGPLPPKSDSGFHLSYLSPIPDAEAATIKGATKYLDPNSAMAKNVKAIPQDEKVALESAGKKYGVNMADYLAIRNAESSVSSKTLDNGPVQMTSAAWKDAEKVAGRKLDRTNPHDYAEASMAFIKHTRDQIKGNGQGTPGIIDTYIAYNAGVSGYRALSAANPNAKSIDIVGSKTADNNPKFYFNAKGKPLTVAQTKQAYADYINHRAETVVPGPKSASVAKAATSTNMALAQAKAPSYDGEPDM